MDTGSRYGRPLAHESGARALRPMGARTSTLYLHYLLLVRMLCVERGRM